MLERGLSQTLLGHICQTVKEVNKAIRENDDLGPGFQIGHSFFCSFKASQMNERIWFENVVKYEITPLLHELWFDDTNYANNMVKKLLEI